MRVKKGYGQVNFTKKGDSYIAENGVADNETDSDTLIGVTS
jgi:hypothetical protein